MTASPTPRAPRRATRTRFDRRDETPRTAERVYGEGVYRRRILVRLDGDRCGGELEDDFHHFRVDLRHQRGEVVEVTGTGVRAPWTACLDAGQPLQALVGTPLTTGPLALSALDARQNCTHMFDLAGLVVTHAARGADGDRLYDITVDDLSGEERERHARLWRDGSLVLDWHFHDRTMIAPPEWVDAPLWTGFIPWAGRALDDDLGEAAVALRRACDISAGRLQDLDGLESAAELLHVMSGICHAFQPKVAPVALRRKGSGRDFTNQEELLLADFDTRS